jgi:hypothetical protein
MGKNSSYCPFNGYQYFQPTRVCYLLPRFFFGGFFSLEMGKKLAHIVPSMDINISNLPVCYLLPSFFFFFCLSLCKAPLNMEPPLPSIQGTIQHSHATNLSNIQTKTLLSLSSLGEGKHDDI